MMTSWSTFIESKLSALGTFPCTCLRAHVLDCIDRRRLQTGARGAILTEEPRPAGSIFDGGGPPVELGAGAACFTKLSVSRSHDHQKEDFVNAICVGVKPDL